MQKSAAKLRTTDCTGSPEKRSLPTPRFGGRASGPAGFLLPVLAALAARSFAGAPLDFDLSWFTIDSGGVTFSGDGTYELGATLGQPDAHEPISDGTFTLSGGFWYAAADCASPSLPGDMNCDGFVTVGDISGFVLALIDPPAYAVAFPACNRLNADVLRDCAVTVQDIGGFIDLIVAGP